MTNTNILFITLIVGFLYILGLWFNYKKEKAEDPHAKKTFAKKILILGVVIVVLNMVIFLFNPLLQKEEPATRKDINRIEVLLNKLSEPT